MIGTPLYFSMELVWCVAEAEERHHAAEEGFLVAGDGVGVVQHAKRPGQCELAPG